MASFLTTASLIAALFFLIMLGVGVLVWLSPVTAEQLTPAQERLIDLADTLVKGAGGAFLGFVVSRFAIKSDGNNPSA